MSRGGKTRGNGSKVKPEMFKLDVMKKFFSMRTTQAVERAAQGICAASSLLMFSRPDLIKLEVSSSRVALTIQHLFFALQVASLSQ